MFKLSYLFTCHPFQLIMHVPLLSSSFPVSHPLHLDQSPLSPCDLSLGCCATHQVLSHITHLFLSHVLILYFSFPVFPYFLEHFITCTSFSFNMIFVTSLEYLIKKLGFVRVCAIQWSYWILRILVPYNNRAYCNSMAALALISLVASKCKGWNCTRRSWVQFTLHLLVMSAINPVLHLQPYY